MVDTCVSRCAELRFGVPQSSVLGPVLFVMYTRSLLLPLDGYEVGSQSFADDTQLFTSCNISQLDSTILRLQQCITEVRAWMAQNKLMLRDDKTEALLIHKSKSLSLSSLPYSVLVGDFCIYCSPSTRHLDFMLSDDMSLVTNINHICRFAYTAIHQIGAFRPSLTIDPCKTLVCALVLSRLDNCNSLLVGSPQQLLGKLKELKF